MTFDDDHIAVELERIDANLVAVESMSADMSASIPRVWADAATSADPGTLLGEVWRHLCPGLPHIADIVEKHTVRVVVARLLRRWHWTRATDETRELRWREPAIVYVMRDAFDPAEIDLKFGWLPLATPAWPEGSRPIRDVLEPLYTGLQDGFVDRYSAGLLPLQDWHSIADMPPDPWQFNVQELRPGQDPPGIDRSRTVIAVEDPASWSHVVCTPDATPPLWSGFNDELTPADDAASAIEGIVGKAWGGHDWHDRI